jgi:hypothetical protein
MMPATQQDRRSLDELIEAHSARLRVLARQAARQGNDTPPHIVTEIEAIEGELAQLKQAAATPVSDALVEELGPTGRYQLWMSHIMRLDMDIGRLRKMIETLTSQQERDMRDLHQRIDLMQYEVLRALGKRPRRPKATA